MAVNALAHKRVAFAAFGCRLNKAEALDAETRFAAEGWEIVPLKNGAEDDESSPDLIVVRGCSVTAKAQRDCEKAIKHLRERHPGAAVRIEGCLKNETLPPLLAGKTGDATLADGLPVGAGGLSAEAGGLPVGGDAVDAETTARKYSVSRAYLKVQDGCSGKCAFCIVPKFRGPPRSVPFAEVLERARAFLANGFGEIILTGCNLCLYKSEGRGIAELARELAGLESAGHRIRFGSVEPGICDERILEAMASAPNICRFLHLSLQSGSERILRLMRRPYAPEDVREFCAKARKALGGRLAFGADLIAGFPGETEAEHEETLRFVKGNFGGCGGDEFGELAAFVHLHVFPYSERPGTEAAAMSGVVDTAVRRRRAKELEAAGMRNRLAFAEALLGKEVVVCVEKDGNGRTDGHFRCVLDGCAAERRTLVRATVTGCSTKDGTLKAEAR